MKRIDWIITILAVLAVVMAGYIISDLPTAWADDSQANVPLYEIGSKGQPSNPIGQSFRIYKMVYQGCELFIVQSDGGGVGYSNAAAIATGRGCK